VQRPRRRLRRFFRRAALRRRDGERARKAERAHGLRRVRGDAVQHRSLRRRLRRLQRTAERRLRSEPPRRREPLQGVRRSVPVWSLVRPGPVRATELHGGAERRSVLVPSALGRPGILPGKQRVAAARQRDDHAERDARDGARRAQRGRSGTSAMPTSTRFASITNGSVSSCATSVTYQVYCWGDNTFGQQAERAAPFRYALNAPMLLSGALLSLRAARGGIDRLVGRRLLGAVRGRSELHAAHAGGLDRDQQLTDRFTPSEMSLTDRFTIAVPAVR